ncbi:UDP-2,3-diacylglucosamine diphosphatase [Thalassolituus oleivorans]|jgi:UDP-2,3-diacylglucosamine hydrolase|uniref:UDP-2,3-diacylglucosamine diphosphatase n=1 Tax=Thalassolituus oleivorans TaxID=187493 RepID=UPI002409D853|nr:UDP-2,3-diacylglucosamine diphosphatase [Thalassolituus oleivorans]MDF1641073.1 UDP-2,3-diacylglucosamine diphosphatase [Thalassolituus oleivorans]
MALYFISDLHLEHQRPAMAAGFKAFVDGLTDAEALYILGDFFEVWMGDDYNDPFVDGVKATLRDAVERGIAVYLMHGNRDFLLGEAFCADIGANMVAEGSVIHHGDESAVILHGDSLCTQDVEYMKIRQMFRSPQWQADFLGKSLEERIAFARHVRSESQSGQQMKSAEIMDVTPIEVDKALDEAGVTRMIHGHTHRPDVHHWQHQGEARERIVLGDWDDTQGWMIRWEKDSAPQLSKFSF